MKYVASTSLDFIAAVLPRVIRYTHTQEKRKKMDTSNVMLKIVVAVHFFLTIWAGMNPGYLPPAYMFMNIFILSFGVWAIALPESRDSVVMFLGLLLFSIIQDIVFISVYQPRAYALFEETLNTYNYSERHEYRFCLGMSIVNLIFKPFSAFLLYRIFQDRGGSYDDLNIPGFPQFGNSGPSPGRYENIDQPVPTSHVETADKSGEQ